jgi:hypothetical protein
MLVTDFDSDLNRLPLLALRHWETLRRHRGKKNPEPALVV